MVQYCEKLILSSLQRYAKNRTENEETQLMYPIITENELVTVTETFVTMPDGVCLYTRYAVPKGVKKCPVVYLRTPYEPAHNGNAHDIEAYRNDQFIRHGYAVLIQHCRGRGDSEGVCVPYRERDDGLSTLDYIRSLPFYNGEIYITGGSYLATVHLCYLSAQPSDIKGACLQIQTDRMYYRNYRNGCNYKLNNASWWAGMLERRFPEQKQEQLHILPYIDAAKRTFGMDIPEFTEGLVHNTCDEYWTSDPRWDVIESLQIPTLFVEGWYDFYIEGMMNMWERLPAETKNKSAMLVGPYGHGTRVYEKAEYPLKNGNLSDDYIVEWFDSIRERKPYKYAECGKIKYYSIGADKWRAGTYPKSNCEHIRLHFAKNGKLLLRQTEGDAVSYRYDPSLSKARYKYGNIYRAHEIGTVEGVLSFVSDLFEKEERFFGKIKLHLKVSSDCEDTAFFARIYFVENGDSYNLTETIGALSHFISDYSPGERVEIELETPPIAFTAKPGVRIRVDISSESGIYLPHSNTKGHFAYVTDTKVATNTIYTKESYVDLCYENGK